MEPARAKLWPRPLPAEDHAHFHTPRLLLDNAQTQRLRACCYTVSKYVEELHSSGMAPRTARARSVHIGHVV